MKYKIKTKTINTKIKRIGKMSDLDKVMIGELVWLWCPDREGIGVYVGRRNGRCFSEKSKDYPVIIRRDIMAALKGLEYDIDKITEQDFYPDDKGKLEIGGREICGDTRNINKKSELYPLYNQILKQEYDKFLEFVLK